MSALLTKFQAFHVPQVNQAMIDFLKQNSTDQHLLESMLYSVTAGGKRMRPLLLLATIKLLQKEISEEAYQVAAALEMVHTYSLIHDDLPAMDDDDLRRGMPTNHKKFGEALAILAGDALLTAAFQLLSETALSAEKRVRLVQLFATASGPAGMIAGQVADIEGENKMLTSKQLAAIHRDKTGKLIICAVVAGALIANATKEETELLEQFAKHFGLAFQIKDDLLDVVGDEREIGKKTGMDAALQKSTYPALLGIEGTKKALETECQAAENALKRLAEVKNTELNYSLLLELLQTLRTL